MIYSNQPKSEQLKTTNIYYPTQFLRIRNPEVARLSGLAQRLSWACGQAVRLQSLKVWLGRRTDFQGDHSHGSGLEASAPHPSCVGLSKGLLKTQLSPQQVIQDKLESFNNLTLDVVVHHLCHILATGSESLSTALFSRGGDLYSTSLGKKFQRIAMYLQNYFRSLG